MRPLKGWERSFLRGLAHHLKPVVQVGRNGVTQNLLGSVRQALDDHELIKVRFLELKDKKRELSRSIAESTGSELLGTLGNVSIFYREHPDEARRVISLPRRPGTP